MNILIKVLLSAPLALTLAVAGCTKAPEQPVGKKPETVREQAEAVGKLSDRTFTSHMEKDLVNVVDKSAENADRLKENAALSDE
ncbi:MAG: hypothetical protein OEV92_09180 [Nitrospinota bacterium]|nr:hypothetical protein [Nitrospinota bacterium]